MYTLKYRVKTLAPVLISSISGDANMTSTFDYIAGSSIRGVFAARYARKIAEIRGDNSNLHLDKCFYRWFLQGELSFGNAYLTILEGQKEYMLYPTPLSIHRDKDEVNIYNLTKVDQEDTRLLGGYVRIKGDSIYHHLPEKGLFFHHNRKDRLKGCSSDGDIFNYEALNESQVFIGHITGAEKEIKEFMRLVGHKFDARIGRSRTTQYGQVEIQLEDIESAADFADNMITEKEDGYETTITFLAPVILRNKHGFPEISTGILQEYLEEALGTGEFSIEQSFVKTEYIETFISVWKLKRPVEKAFAAGSTFKLVFKRKPDDRLQQKLRSLWLDGLGERKGEGFGRFAFNLAVEENYFKKELKPVMSEKPDGLMPKAVKEILGKIIIKKIEASLETMAIEDSEEFFVDNEKKNTISNSLLGRLELMLRDSRNMEEMAEKTGQLQATARGNLSAYWNKTKEIDLYGALKNNSLPDWEQFILKYLSDQLKSMGELAGLNLRLAENIEQKRLAARYWLTFFRNTRQLNKKGGKA